MERGEGAKEVAGAQVVGIARERARGQCWGTGPSSGLPSRHPGPSCIQPWHGDLHLRMEFCVAHPQSPLEQGLEPWQGLSWGPRMRADWLRSTRETVPRGDTGCGEVGTCQRLGLVPGGATSEGLIHQSAGERAGHTPKAALPRPRGRAGRGQWCPRPGVCPSPPSSRGAGDFPHCPRPGTLGVSTVTSTRFHTASAEPSLPVATLSCLTASPARL